MTVTAPPAPVRPVSGGPAPAPTRPPQLRAWVPRTVALGGLVVVLPWLLDDPVGSGAAGALTGLGRLTGLLGGYAIAVLVLLMARLPPLEDRVGADVLARWHAWGGRWTVGLLSAHAVLVTWGYAATAHASLPSQSWTLLRSYPNVLAATVALALLLGVAAVSARAARRRMRYETWYWLHFYTYLAIGLAFAHTLTAGTDLQGGTVARAGWVLLYAATAGLLLWYRVGTPLHTVLASDVRVLQVRDEAPGVVSLVLAGRRLDELGGRAGQFVRVRLLTRDGWWQSHPWSLSAPPTRGLLRVTVKDLGDGSRAVAAAAPGTRVLLEGPYGALTSRVRTRRRVLLVGAGIGVAPLRALFEALPGDPGDLLLVHRARTPDDLVLRRELEHLARVRGNHYVPVVGPRGAATDLTAERLRRLAPDVASRDVYVCGPLAFQDAVTEALLRAGVPAAQIHSEHFEL